MLRNFAAAIRHSLAGALLLALALGLAAPAGTAAAPAPAPAKPQPAAGSPIPAAPAGTLVDEAGALGALDRARVEGALVAAAGPVRFRILLVESAGALDRTDYLDRVTAQWGLPAGTMTLVVFTRDNHDIRFAMGAGVSGHGLTVEQMLALVRGTYFPGVRSDGLAGGLIALVRAVDARVAVTGSTGAVSPAPAPVPATVAQGPAAAPAPAPAASAVPPLPAPPAAARAPAEPVPYGTLILLVSVAILAGFLTSLVMGRRPRRGLRFGR